MATHEAIRAFLKEDGLSAIESVQDCLSPRQRGLLALLYVPTEAGVLRTVDEAAKEFGVPKTRVIAIERSAMYAIAGYMRRWEVRRHLLD
jgi:DNA-directed RNA polymerase sigma subunit (sigma70/sigma32)